MSKFTNTGALVVHDESGGGGGGGTTTVDNAAGAAAVNVQDGGNAITVDDGGGSLTVDGSLSAIGSGSSPSTDITRPSNTTPYTAGDRALADATPTTGGFTLAGAVRISDGSGILASVVVTSSNNPGTLLQGEIHFFNAAVTAIADNGAWTVSAADAKKRVAVVPFTLKPDGANSYYDAQNLNKVFTCVDSADLRFLVKEKNGYTPASAEVVTVTAQIVHIN